MFKMNFLQNNTIFYSSIFNPLSANKSSLGGQFLGKIRPNYALVNNDIKSSKYKF